MGRQFQLRDPADFEEPIWQKQTALGETNEYYVMFLSFSGIRPTARNIAVAWREWTKGTDQEGTMASSTYRQLAAAFHWAERAAARDVQELRDKYVKWGERDWDWREGDYQTGDSLRKQALRALTKLDAKDDLTLDLQTVLSMLQTASQLQKNSIPNIGALTSTQVQDILAALPDSKRKRVLRIVMAEYREDADQPLPGNGASEDDIVDGEIVQPKQLTNKSGIGRNRGQASRRKKAQDKDANQST